LEGNHARFPSNLQIGGESPPTLPGPGCPSLTGIGSKNARGEVAPFLATASMEAR